MRVLGVAAVFGVVAHGLLKGRDVRQLGVTARGLINVALRVMAVVVVGSRVASVAVLALLQRRAAVTRFASVRGGAHFKFFFLLCVRE